MSESTNTSNKRKSPSANSTICTRCQQYDLKCNYTPGESRCEACLLLNKQCVPIHSTSINHAHTNNNNTNNNAAAAVGAAHSYNQWVAQAAVNNNHASNSAPRFPPPSQHPPPPPYHGGMQHGIMPQPYAAMAPQPPKPPPQFQQVLLTNPAAAAPYVYHPPRNDQPTTTNNNNNNPAPPSNTTHPSFTYLSMTAAANPTAATTATNHPPPPPQLIPPPPPPNAAQISQALTARYAARAMNGGHEPNTAQIVEMMNRMNAAAAGAAANGVALLGNSGAASGYINHPTNYASLGSGKSGAAGTNNVVHSSSAAPPQPPSQPRAAKRQRTTQQPQQKKRRFTTGTTLTIHNSIIPCPKGGVKSIDSKTALEEITRRVRNECAILSLLPSDEFIADKRERGELVCSISSKNKWLRCAVTLVYSSLNLESPNPVGWDEGIMNDLGTTSKKKRGGGGRVKRAHWFKGLYHKLCGPQPWQCTRPFVAKAVYQLLLAEGCADWLISEHRWGAMERMVRPIIAVNLSIWKPQVFGNRGDVLKTHSKLIWRQYRADQLRTIQDCEKALVPPQIGSAYVRHVANCSDWPILRTVEKKEEESAASEGEVIDLSTTVVEVSPDPVPVCMPVGEANNNGFNFMWESKWTCDYCSASFSDYDEAVTHENECKEKSLTAAAANDDESKPKESLDTEQTDNDGDAVVENHIEFAMEEKWKCDYCPKSFAVYDEAVAHESECKAKSQAAEVANDDESKTNEIPDTDQTIDDVGAESHVEFAMEEKWNCDYCSASFAVYDEAAAHEAECKSKSQLAEAVDDDESKTKGSSDTKQTMDDGVCVVESSVEDEAAANEAECKAKSMLTEAADDDESKTKESSDKENDNIGVESNVEFAVEENWKCDYCSASFAVYDEAVAHETECKAKSQLAEAANDDEIKTKEGPDKEQTVVDGDCVVESSLEDEAAANEADCKSKSQLAEAADDDESKTKESLVTKETMDDGDGGVESSLEDEAAANEAECKAKSQLAEAADDDESKTKESPVTKETMDDGAGVVESSAEDEAAANEAECKSKSQLAEAADDDESKTKESPVTKETMDDGAGVVESSAEDEAVAHENKCKAQSRVVELVDEENEVKVNSGASDDDAEVYARGWKCDYCPASFSVYDEAVAHENECKAKSQGEEEKKAEEVVDVTETNVEANQSSVEGKGGFVVEEKWKCDYCSASFSVFDEAVSHESECKAKMQSAVVDDTTTDKENQTSDEFGEKKVDHVVEEQWQCDYCEARFSDFDEAAAHEAECKRMSEAPTSLPSSSSVSNRDVDAAPQHAGLLDAVNGTDFFASDKLRSSMLKTLEKLHYEYFPLMSGGDKKLGEVCEKVLRCLHAVTPINKENEIASKRRVECVLNHLEHRSGYLSNLNGIFRLRVNTTALMDDSNPESPAEDVISLMSESEAEDPEEIVVTYGLNSDGDQVIMAANSPEGAVEEGAAKSRMPHRIDTAILDRSTPCGECILCNAPDCERCFLCLSKGRSETDVCIRKSCCKIPFENKAKSLVGFPPEWQYAFCDPNQGALVKSPRRILSLAGLVIRRPMSAAFQTPGYQYFHSFEAAFSSVQHEDTSEATKLVESFLSHVHGSDAMKSYPKHFLVGRRFCFEFTNVNGMNVAMFGVISTCFRESSEAETDMFMVQYDSDCIEIAAKSLGTTILRLQLISSEQAWGGCISFERKARIRGRHSVVRSIDQATAVEYWVTPDMRMEEMVEQDDGIKVPMLTILLRGYKFVFSAHNDDEGIAVSVSCISMNVDDGTADESILKPGELIDLGVFCPLSDSDTKPLPVFLLKNYVHNFSIDSYAGDGNGNVYDLTEDAKGTMHLAATKRVLSYVRSCNDMEVPTIHGGLDPSGKVHLLFGVRYRGDWKEYTSIMEEEIHPIFRGEQKEVTLARNAMINEQQEARYLSAMKNFGPVELLQCAKFIGSLFLGSPTAVPSSGMKERLFRVATCLRHRIAELGDPSINAADQLIQRSIDQVKASRQQQTVTGRLFAPHIAKTF